MMNTVKNRILMATLLILAGIACRDNADEHVDIIEGPGVLPSSMEQIIDVFELKYGEIKEWSYNGRIFGFSIEDIEDNLINCSVAYIPGGNLDPIRIHAYLRVETDGEVFRLKVSSKSCGPNSYTDEDSDSNVRYIWDLLERWQSNPSDPRFFPRFEDQFKYWFGEGTPLNTSLNIFMAKAYTRLQHNQENNKSVYKFIFIITN
jgi:hypothetical protein